MAKKQTVTNNTRVTPESRVEEIQKKAEPAIKKVRMTACYIGSKGCFYPGRTYDMCRELADELVKNGEAIEC